MVAAVSVVAEPALASEPQYPRPTKETIVGEWAGYWRGKPLGLVEVFVLRLDAKLAGTIVRSGTAEFTVVYDIDDASVEDGKVLIHAHDRERPRVEAMLEGTGGVWGRDGWLDITFKDLRNDTLVFQLRLEKTPDQHAKKLRRLLDSGRSADKRIRRQPIPDARPPIQPLHLAVPPQGHR